MLAKSSKWPNFENPTGICCLHDLYQIRNAAIFGLTGEYSSKYKPTDRVVINVPAQNPCTSSFWAETHSCGRAELKGTFQKDQGHDDSTMSLKSDFLTQNHCDEVKKHPPNPYHVLISKSYLDTYDLSPSGVALTSPGES